MEQNPPGAPRRAPFAGTNILAITNNVVNKPPDDKIPAQYSHDMRILALEGLLCKEPSDRFTAQRVVERLSQASIDDASKNHSSRHRKADQDERMHRKRAIELEQQDDGPCRGCCIQ